MTPEQIAENVKRLRDIYKSPLAIDEDGMMPVINALVKQVEETQEAIDILKGLFDESQPWSLADWVYDVRESVQGIDKWEGSSWEHPAVKRYSSLIERAEKLLKTVSTNS